EQSHLGEQTVGDLELHRVRRGNADIAVLDRSDQLGLDEFGDGVTVDGYRALRRFRRGTPGQHHRQQGDQDHRSENPTDRPAPTTYTHISPVSSPGTPATRRWLRIRPITCSPRPTAAAGSVETTPNILPAVPK